MNNTLLQFNSKIIHKAYTPVHVLLSLMLSWAALDHLIGPKDLADILRRLSATTLLVAKVSIGYAVHALKEGLNALSLLTYTEAADNSNSYISTSF
jgi:hypothetical protein